MERMEERVELECRSIIIASLHSVTMPMLYLLSLCGNCKASAKRILSMSAVLDRLKSVETSQKKGEDVWSLFLCVCVCPD